MRVGQYTFMIIWDVSDKFVEKIKRQLYVHFPANRAFHEVMWKNMVQPDKPQMAM